MQLKLILKDGTGIELEEASYTQHYVVSCKDAKAFQRIWNKLTDENLSEIQITEEGNTVHTIIGSSLEGTQTVKNPDGTLTGHFYFGGGERRQPEAEIPQEQKE